MGYFTHWDANLYWCFLNMGLPVDLIRDWMVEIRGEHDKFTLEYYLDRSEWMPKTGSDKEKRLLRDRPTSSEIRKRCRSQCFAYGYGKEINLCAISSIKCIPHNFWMNIQKVNYEFETKVKELEPDDKYDYFEWGFMYQSVMNDHVGLEWVKGFHTGRLFLMDLRRQKKGTITTMEDIRDLESDGWFAEEDFITNQRHIDDII